MKKPSKERGCDGKTGISARHAIDYAERLAVKHGKYYGVYRCPHCGLCHLTTKIKNQADYAPLLHTTKRGMKT